MANNLFSVVDFYKEKKVAVVLTSWLEKKLDKCAWPSGPGAADKLTSLAPPEKNWQRFACRHKHYAGTKLLI